MLSDVGLACDVCVWSDFTHQRLQQSAKVEAYTLRAAEKYKDEKYAALCKAGNLDFAPLAVNPLGGLGPRLVELLDKIWQHRVSEAKATGADTRKLESKYRRALERLSAEMVRCAHRAIYSNTTGRGVSPTTHADADDDRMDAGEQASQ